MLFVGFNMLLIWMLFYFYFYNNYWVLVWYVFYIVDWGEGCFKNSIGGIL